MDEQVGKQQEIKPPNKRRIFIVIIASFIIILIFAVPYYLNLHSQKSPQQNNGSAVNTSITNPPSETFQYDTKKAETLVTDYLKQNVKPEFLPETIEVKQGLSTNGTLGQEKGLFGAFFEIKEATIAANFHFKENTATPNNFSIFIQPKNISQTTATKSLATSLLSTYFLNPYEISDCKVTASSSYCESFKTTAEGKKGYGIAFINSAGLNGPAKLMPIIFNCFVPKESKFFDWAKSCIAL